MFRTPVILPLVAALWLAPQAAPAQETKRQDLKATAVRIAEEVKALAAAQNQASVYLGEFNPVGLRTGDGRPALEAELRAALAGFLNDKSPLELYGTFEYTDVDGVVGKVINIEATLKDTKTKRVIKTIVAPILYVPDIARFGGFSGAIAAGGTSGDARKALEQLQAKPTAAPSGGGGTRVKPHPASPYEVEILVRKDGSKGPPAAKSVAFQNGLPFVSILPGEVYEVRVLNHSDHEAAVKLAIDGLDQFAFTDDRDKGQPRYTHYILPAAKGGRPAETIIHGWHKKYDDVAGKHRYNEFLVTEYGRSGIVNKPRAKVGMIELAFALSFTEDERSKARGDAETGRGKEGEVKGTVVVRRINPPTEFVTVRYNREIK